VSHGGTAPVEETLAALIDARVRAVPDFPQAGVVFRDITPLLSDGDAFGAVIRTMAARYVGRVDAVAGIEARGFILAAPVAAALGVGMIAVRKASKLPPPVLSEDYALEYGTASIELSTLAIQPGGRVLVVDDVLATGGTAAAACQLLEDAGARVEAVEVLIEIVGLGGRALLLGRDVHALLAV
jgi:adenine phosphoribosyltransferase